MDAELENSPQAKQAALHVLNSERAREGLPPLLALPETAAAAGQEIRMAAEEVKPVGLQTIIRAGEMLPWKHINFVVEHVSFDRVVLKPTSTTNAFKKKKARGQKD